jgi:hypothetical protein
MQKNILTDDQVRQASKLSDGWPVYVYSQEILTAQAKNAVAMPSAF